MGFGNLAGDEQSQAGALGLLAHKGLEEPVADGRGRAGARVLHGHAGLVAVAGELDADLSRPTVGPAGGLDRVKDQVDQDLPQGLGVAQHGQWFLGRLEAQVDLGMRAGRADQPQHVAHQRLQVERARGGPPTAAPR